MQFYYTTLPKHYKYNSVGMLYFFISLIFIFLYSISLSKCLESNIDSIDNWRLYFNNSLVIPTPHSNLFLSLTTLVGAWQQHRNLTSASYSRRAGLNYWSIIITTCFIEQVAKSVFMYSYLSLAFLFPWFTQYLLNRNCSQQKGHGVSHNPPQVDKVLPWSIQFSRNNSLTALREILFNFMVFITSLNKI